MKLLYAEDERALSDAVVDILTYHKYLVDAVYDGADALDYARADSYDGIILDIMMPRMDGLTVLKTLRAQGIKTPILLLTAKSEVEDQIAGLDLGADDYLSKPFSMELLLARIRAMLRRKETFTPSVLCCGDLNLDQRTFELSCGDKRVTLPKAEYRLMEVLMLNQGACLSTDQLIERAWGYDSEAEANTVWVYLSYLRKRIRSVGSRAVISAKRNLGYTLEEGL